MQDPQPSADAVADDAARRATARIFVRIPAYRDPEVLETVERLLTRAERPERVSVGICWQFDAGAGEGPLAVPERWRAQVRVLDVPAAESQGPCWARHQAETLLADEDFVLGVDAHTQPAVGWDAALLDTWSRCGPQAVLSGPLAGYKPPDLLRSDVRPGFRRPARFDRGELSLRTGFFDGYPEAPVQVAFVHRRFVFAPAACVRAVPTDPTLYLEDDVAYSLRLFTHGWDVYAPTDVLLWHRFNDGGDQRPLHWKHHPDWRRLRGAARKRIRRLTGFEPLKAHELPDADDGFGLGRARSAADFADFCGFDLAAGRPTADAERCAFIRNLRDVARVEGYWIPPPPAPPTVETPALQVGDFAPYMTLPMARGRKGELQLYAGAPTALFFVPADAPAAEPFVALLMRRAADFEKAGVQAVIVAVGPMAERVRAGRPTVWFDRDGAAARAFGTGPNGERAFLLDRNLRVAALHTGLTASAIGAIVDRGRTLAELDDRDARTIDPHPPVLVVPDAIDAELRAALLDAWQDGDHFQGRTGSAGGSTVRLKRKVRTDVQIPRDLRARIDAALVGRLLPEIEKVFGFRPTRREAYKVGCYPADGGGFFSQHRDNFEPALAHRRVAMTLNLNDDFGGGRLVFPEYGPDGYRPAAGTAVIFPCALMHRVDPVTAGLRFTLVSFFTDENGARLRRQMRRVAGLPPPDDDRRFTAPRRGAVSHHEDVRHRFPMSARRADDETPLRPVTLVEARGAGNPEAGRMRRDTPPGVMVIDHYLHPDACRRITDYALAAPGRPLQVLDHDKTSEGKLVTVASDKRITEKVKIDGLAPEIVTLFTDVYGHRLEPHYGVEFEWFERPQILRYGPGGKYHAHADAEHYDKAEKRYVRAQDRDYSVLVYVNDDYEGGAIAFPKLDYEVQPRAGMLIAFPSDHRYEHAARPTTAGTRLALVSWAAVRGTPRVRPRPPYGAVILRPR